VVGEIMFFSKKNRSIEMRWRDTLNDYEKETLIPGLKERMTALRDYFSRVNALCDQHLQDDTFGVILNSLVAIPSGVRPITPQRTNIQMSQWFFGQIKTMVQENYLVPIDGVLAKHNETITYKSFAEILNTTNYICASAVNSKEELFLWEFSSFYSKHDTRTGNVTEVVPQEFTVLLMPFKNILRHIVNLCEWTQKTIHHWHEQEMEWRSRSLEIENHRISIKNQMVTIFLTLALSAAFMFFTQPLDLYQKSKIIDDLSAKLTSQKTNYEAELGALRAAATKCSPAPAATSPNYQPQGPTSKPGAKK
jgi:hypothetical protein